MSISLVWDGNKFVAKDATSSQAHQNVRSSSLVPNDLFGNWSTDPKICQPGGSPDQAITYTFSANHVSFYAYNCHVRQVVEIHNSRELDLDCMKSTGPRHFDRVLVHRIDKQKLNMLSRRDSSSMMLHWCGPLEPPVPPSPSIKSQWTHNGSLMLLEEEEALEGESPSELYIEIQYIKPRSGLHKAGVRPGTMLLFGQKEHSTIEATAYIFHTRCGPQSYSVIGGYQRDSSVIHMTGMEPRFNAACEETDKRPTHLIFEKIIQR